MANKTKQNENRNNNSHAGSGVLIVVKMLRLGQYFAKQLLSCLFLKHLCSSCSFFFGRWYNRVSFSQFFRPSENSFFGDFNCHHALGLKR